MSSSGEVEMCSGCGVDQGARGFTIVDTEPTLIPARRSGRAKGFYKWKERLRNRTVPGEGHDYKRHPTQPAITASRSLQRRSSGRVLLPLARRRPLTLSRSSASACSVMRYSTIYLVRGIAAIVPPLSRALEGRGGESAVWGASGTRISDLLRRGYLHKPW